MKVKSCTFTESASKDYDEFVIEYEQTLLQKLFKKPATVKTYFGNCTVWWDRDSETRAGMDMEVYISNQIAVMKYEMGKKK